LKEEPPVRRISRPPKDRLRPTEYAYGTQKFPKPISDLIKKCTKVLSQIQKHQFSVPFLKPVDYVALNLPDYPLIVKEPMDLSKVEKKLRSGAYSTPMQFAADVRKIWSNAILYNPKTNPIYDMTIAISEFFEEIFKPVEENPFPDQNNEYLNKRVGKLEKKLNEMVNFSSGGRGSEQSEYLDTPMSLEDKKALTFSIKSLQPCDLLGIRLIVCEANPELRNHKEITFDIAKLETKVLRKIERYVKSKLMLVKMNKKIAAKKEQKLKAEHDKALLAAADEHLQKEEIVPEILDGNPVTATGSENNYPRKNTEDEDDNDDNKGSDSSFFTSMPKLPRFGRKRRGTCINDESEF